MCGEDSRSLLAIRGRSLAGSVGWHDTVQSELWFSARQREG
jgi:hypothetical protein